MGKIGVVPILPPVEGLKVVRGSYTGNGASVRTISLGSTPLVVIVYGANGLIQNPGSGNYLYGGIAATGMSANIVGIVNGGFQVYQDQKYNMGNQNGQAYRYIAFVAV